MSSAPIKFITPLLLIPAILMFVWFRNGLTLGGGEEGILFYNTNKTLQLSTSVWIDYMTGITNVNWLPRAPVIYLSTLFEKIGIPLFIFQLMLFYILIIIGICSVYYLVVNLLDQYKSRNIIALISAVFYLFNPFTFSQVWGRSLYTQYFAFSLLPLALLLFYLGIKRKKYIFGFLIAITSALLAGAYGFLTFIIVNFFVLMIYFIFHVLTSQDRKTEAIFGIKFIFLTFALWCLFNTWWFVPLVSNFSNVYTTVISGSEHNLGTLLGVSRNYTPDLAVRLLHKGYFFDLGVYSPIYSTLPFQLISLLPLFFVVIGLVKTMRNKELVKLRFFVVLLVLGLVISLGANPPLGWLFVWFFEHITPLQAFRNPFEKFGLVYALGYSVIFAYGLASFLERWNLKNLLLGLVLILTCGIYAWPMWTGRVIAGLDKKIGLDIPTYYKDLQSWLENQRGDYNVSLQERSDVIASDYRLLMTPIWAGDGAYYRWNNAARYQGVDPMIFMLDQPPISNSSRAPFFGDFLVSIRKNMERENVVPAISLLRAKFLIDRKDAIIITDREKDQYKFLTSSIYPPQGIESNLKTICQNIFADSKSNGVAWVICQIPTEDSNLSNIRYLHLKLKTDVPASVEVALRDARGVRIRWDGRADSDYHTDINDWQYITIPLSNPTEINYEIDFSKIAILEVLAHPEDNALASVGEINIAEIKLDPGIQKQIDEFKKVVQFGNLSVFEPNHFNPPPEFGSLLKIDKVKDFIELFDQTNQKRDLINVNGFLLPSQNLDKDLSKLDDRASLQVLDKQKISDTRYWMRAGGERGYGFIILSNRFDPNWKVVHGISKKAVKGGFFNDLELLRRASLSEDNHFVVNGYANLWKIDERDTQYGIIFMPQVIADISLKISFFSVISVVGFLILWKIAKKYTSLL